MAVQNAFKRNSVLSWNPAFHFLKINFVLWNLKWHLVRHLGQGLIEIHSLTNFGLYKHFSYYIVTYDKHVNCLLWSDFVNRLNIKTAES